MLATDVGRALLIGSVPVAYALGHLTWAQLYVVAFVTGALSVLFYVAYGGLFQLIVPREQYVAANSLLHGSRAFSFLAGNSVGGVLVQLLRGPYALAVDALSFLWSALFLGRMSFVFFALFVLYATRSLDIRPGTLGLVLGAGAVGSVIGSLVTGRLARRVGVGPAFVLGCLLFPAPLLLVPLAGGPQPIVLALLFLAEFGSGFGVMILDISAGSIFAALIPDGMRARVSGAYLVVNYGVRPIGSLLGGFLGATIGLRPTLWIATVGGVLGVLWLLPSPVRSLRELPEPAG